MLTFSCAREEKEVAEEKELAEEKKLHAEPQGATPMKVAEEDVVKKPQPVSELGPFGSFLIIDQLAAILPLVKPNSFVALDIGEDACVCVRACVRVCVCVRLCCFAMSRTE